MQSCRQGFQQTPRAGRAPVEGVVGGKGGGVLGLHINRPFRNLRTDSCDERRIYKSEDISGHKGGTYMFNTSPKSPDFCLSNDVWQELPRVNFKKK